MGGHAGRSSECCYDRLARYTTSVIDHLRCWSRNADDPSNSHAGRHQFKWCVVLFGPSRFFLPLHMLQGYVVPLSPPMPTFLKSLVCDLFPRKWCPRDSMTYRDRRSLGSHKLTQVRCLATHITDCPRRGWPLCNLQ